jgi:hypothetical protein
LELRHAGHRAQLHGFPAPGHPTGRRVQGVTVTDSKGVPGSTGTTDIRQPDGREADLAKTREPAPRARRRFRLSMPVGPLLALPFAIGIGLLLGQFLSPVEIVATCLGTWLFAELIFLALRMASAISGRREEKRLEQQAELDAAAQRKEAQNKQSRDAQLLAGIREKAASVDADPSEALGVNVRFLGAKGGATSRAEEPEPDDPWAEASARSRER